VVTGVAKGPTGSRWLILSYFSRIDGMACAQHIDDRIGQLRIRGIEPLMLTGVCGGRWPGLVHERAFSAAPSGLRFELRHLKKRGGLNRVWGGLLNLLILPLYLLEKLVIDLDSQWSWFPLAILQGRRMCVRHRPQLIYSTGGPASAHLAAAAIARRHRIPWIAEFQDPLVHDDWLRSGRALKVFTWLERLICSRADAVIFLTDQARRNADRRTGLSKRGWTVYPGADPAALPDPAGTAGSECSFAHFGSLGGSRNLKTFLAALRLLLIERPELARVIRLDLYGSCDRLSRRLIDEFPIADVIRDHGRIPRQESLLAMQRCAVLLLIQNTEAFSAETIPSKTYEYLHIGRPILGLLHQNPELGQMLSALGHTAVPADAPEAVKQAIAACYDSWKRSGTRSKPAASPYSIAAALEKVVAIAEAVLSPDASAAAKAEKLNPHPDNRILTKEQE
jgi:glycosyltransferase involved in cell wall biosynthesis